MKRLFLILVLGLLVGCATTANYEKEVNNWLGRHKNDLIAEWGIPKGELDMGNGRTLIEYEDRRTNYFQGVSYDRWCRTSFLVSDSGIIMDRKIQGNDCTR